MRALPLVATLGLWSSIAAATSVVGSKHDLSVTGPGPIKAETETRVCIFCHLTHGGTARALGGRPDIGNSHVPYESTTLRNRAKAPSGATRVCLSCHDGTIAVGRTRRYSIRMNAETSGGKIPATRRSNLGTDLRGTHPVSIGVLPSGKVRRPSDAHVKLDDAGELQCTSCHDAHAEFGGSPEGLFLVTPSEQLCTSCHEPTRGSHASGGGSRAAVKRAKLAEGAASATGCNACHASHGAAPGGRLVSLQPTEKEDVVCVRCHGPGGGARTDVSRDVSKLSSHAVDGGRVHDAAEGPDAVGHRLPEISPSVSRHAVCVDCHEPHDASSGAAQAPFAQGALAGTWGIDASGRKVEPVRFEYEICFKCHGDSANKPLADAAEPRPHRRVEERNLRRVFDAGAASYHPVVAPARGGDVPSLSRPYAPGSQIYCTDCHASDSGPGAGGTGPRGPHGSIYAPLLERNYSTRFPTPETPFAYALCYKCHGREVLLSDASAFPLHRRHVVNGRAPCSACHSAHGVAATAGDTVRNAHLIDFDVGLVGPSRLGAPRYERRGPRSGSCSLTCHGIPHQGVSY